MQSTAVDNDVMMAAVDNLDYQRIVNKVIKSSINRPIYKEELKAITEEIIWESLKNFRKNEGMKFTSYLYQTARFKIKKLHTAEAKNRYLPKKRVTESDITRTHFYKVIADDILESLKETDEKAYNLLIDRFYLGLTYREIGNKLGVTKEHVRVLVKKAIEACRELCIVD